MYYVCYVYEARHYGKPYALAPTHITCYLMQFSLSVQLLGLGKASRAFSLSLSLVFVSITSPHDFFMCLDPLSLDSR